MRKKLTRAWRLHPFYKHALTWLKWKVPVDVVLRSNIICKRLALRQSWEEVKATTFDDQLLLGILFQ